MREQQIVYVLDSESNPKRYYTGLTSDIRARLAAHNDGLSRHTADRRPWRVVVYRVRGSRSGDGVRDLSHVGFRPRVRKATFQVSLPAHNERGCRVTRQEPAVSTVCPVQRLPSLREHYQTIDSRLPKGADRVDAHGAEGRNHGRRDARNRKHDTSADKRQRIGCRHAKQLRLDVPRA